MPVAVAALMAGCVFLADRMCAAVCCWQVDVSLMPQMEAWCMRQGEGSENEKHQFMIYRWGGGRGRACVAAGCVACLLMGHSVGCGAALETVHAASLLLS
jgi:hypothetical protein